MIIPTDLGCPVIIFSKLEGEPLQGLHRRIEAFSCDGSKVPETQSPNARISVPIAYLLHVSGAHTNRRDQNEYDPRYESTKWTLELCHQHPGTVFVRGQTSG
ncbi:hypothetical protein TNIN_241801 [Trichonephila inaurata madagascariensis]|uniref:Uncharacterized protein n=1 Tax=Trichonephila inaurata madagascariensis TaxID=2747483 RepID=A0A8X6XHM5_9ARAC|nr:hypothetical protein TNIN_241801 [Trichonephila inaurata madagascariensis]